MPTAPADDLLPPVSRLTAVAALAPPSTTAPSQSYKPTSADYAIAGALFSANAETLQDLADASGVSDSTLGRVLADPLRAAWIVNRGCEAAKLAKSAVYRRIIDQALVSKNPTWAKLALEIVDPEHKRGSQPASAVNTQVNIVSGLSDSELRAMAQQLVRTHLGSQSPK